MALGCEDASALELMDADGLCVHQDRTSRLRGSSLHEDRQHQVSEALFVFLMDRGVVMSAQIPCMWLSEQHHDTWAFTIEDMAYRYCRQRTSLMN